MSDTPRRIMVSGASGMVAETLLPRLKSSGYQVVRLSRNAKEADQIQWDPNRLLDAKIVSDCDAVIHLAGESVMGRWTPERKSRIRHSRVVGTRNLAQSLVRAANRPQVMICASAIGYYGDRGDEVLREDSASGSGFLPEVCREWEAAAKPAEDAGIRVAHVRIGVVLSARGGALEQMLPPFRLGLGGRIGSGRQWFSWIHVEDLVSAMLFMLQDEHQQGVFNGTAPGAVTNAEFTKVLASVLNRPAILPVPAVALRLAFGAEMADEALLSSARVEPARLLRAGFSFEYPELSAALKTILKR